ncbi:hypothetical protein E2C01_056341 [Portunus trituberculatus]|uniref:Uncharacterized protein n=1 Tax=Portunus trituberculatus TaxID=210409 RepID=A0A5B7GZC8_PORTR|nr:hypothetical protein [Portunus trituberculatus]
MVPLYHGGFKFFYSKTVGGRETYTKPVQKNNLHENSKRCNIVDAYGECVIDTTSSRSTAFLLSQMMDSVSHNGDWAMYSDTTLIPKYVYLLCIFIKLLL